MGAPAASAAVSAMPCAPKATIVARGGHGYLMWAGLETSGVLARFNGSTLTRGQHFYQLQGEVIRVSFGGDSIAWQTTPSLVRQPQQHAALTMLQKISWYLDLVNQPVGRTAVWPDGVQTRRDLPARLQSVGQSAHHARPAGESAR